MKCHLRRRGYQHIALTVVIVSVLFLSSSVSAEREDIDTVWGFDKTTGEVNSHTYGSSDSPGVNIEVGNAQVNLHRFYGLKMTFKYKALQKSDSPLYVYIADSEHKENYVRIRLITPDSTKTCFQTYDYYEEEKHNYKENKDSNTRYDMRTIKITISYTNDNTDGKTKNIEILISGSVVYRHKVLYEPELTGEMQERQWDTIYFEGEEPGDEFLIDTVSIETESYESEFYAGIAPTSTAAIAAVGLAVVTIFFIYRRGQGPRRRI